MVEVRCDNEECDDQYMELTETDDRQEWVEETYECPKCGKMKTHKTVFDQIGLAISDTVYDEEAV